MFNGLCFLNRCIKPVVSTLAVLLLLIPLSPSALSQHLLPYQAVGKHLGAVTCANSLCHGSVTQWKDSNILQNEYITWSRVDKHHNKAYQVLFNAQSQRIVKNLGLKTPAHETKICLDCHTHNVPTATQGERFVKSDGISCEACHGPAEGWIKTHVEPNASHAANVRDGLFPLPNATEQAKLCLSCHFGNRDKFVTHRIMGAGHPRMSFELDTFVQLSPAHFKVDEDYVKRKGDYDPIRLWAIGQALAVNELLTILADPKRGRDGLFPELTLFDCHACHHPMSEKRWQPKQVGWQSQGPGRVRLNDSNLLMLRLVVRRAMPSEAAAFEAHVLSLNRAMAGESNDDPIELANTLKVRINSLIPGLQAKSFSNADIKAMALNLLAESEARQYTDYAGAEQAAMGLTSLTNMLVKRGGMVNVGDANKALERVFTAVRFDEKYVESNFRTALQGLRAQLSRN